MENNEKDGDNLGSRIYHVLRLRLIVGALAPHDSLSIRTLADEFGVSTMPVREALKRLEAESALAGSAKRAYRVPTALPEDIASVFFVRAALEGAGAELAVDCLKPADLKQLRMHALAMDDAWSRLDSHDFLMHNFCFHSLIYRSTRNTCLCEIAETLYARSGPWLGKVIRELAEKDDWANEHHKIVDAFEAGDRRGVRSLIEADVSWGSSFFRDRQQSPG